MKEEHFRVLGIDTGSVTTAVALFVDGKPINHAYKAHGGRSMEMISILAHQLMLEVGITELNAIAATNTTPANLRADFRTDGRIAAIECARRRHPGLRSLLIVGAERFSRTDFDKNGVYKRMRGNSACAAGTGSFLDQQAVRLGLDDGKKLAQLAMANTGAHPKIASRCSVFAKTDLIHAQQEGWSLPEICDGLCRGLARNIADTLFPGEAPLSPLVFAGGVALNRAVARHLGTMLGLELITDTEAALYGAIGAAYRYLEGTAGVKQASSQARKLESFFSNNEQIKAYANLPLKLTKGAYPDFEQGQEGIFIARKGGIHNPVEIDIFEELKDKASKGQLKAALGFDIGSTSTKAALLSETGKPLAGFYTRTAGQPLEAAQSILEALEKRVQEADLKLEIVLLAATGSGRKLIGAILGADAVIDEISAHARAAVMLDNQVDTIIEIGGQDSKFTALKNASVVFSQMNTVCAAGTGSFIEEQAARLGVPISEYAKLAVGVASPLTSDRCTVFMERDLNQLLAQGYSVRELLAAALFSVADNYLSKVAREGAIGDHIVFQGATAKNRALVAAFERRLGKAIQVSRYCHLTGAVGAALQALDEGKPKKSAFRGLDLHREDFTFRSAVCDGCRNHCKLRVINVQGEDIVYGYLCGREKGDKVYVSKDKSGFDLLRERESAFRDAKRKAEEQLKRRSLAQESAESQISGKKAFDKFFPIDIGDLGAKAGGAVTALSINAIDSLTDAVYKATDLAMRNGTPKAAENSGDKNTRAAYPTIGIPTGLYMAESAPYWKWFFERLGFPVVLPPRDEEMLAKGKRIAGAEFCAPVALMHGQAEALLKLSDFIFLPTYLEEASKSLERGESRRVYCNYSQFAPAYVAMATGQRERFLRPLVAGLRGDDSNTPAELRSALVLALKDRDLPVPAPSEVRRAYLQSRALRSKVQHTYRDLFIKAAPLDDFAVIIAGRPYTALPREMNKNIPDFFANQGIRVFFQDMIPSLPLDNDALFKAFHWRYASEILETARFCARTDRYYAVLISSFKCSPDSFAVESFKRILDQAGKPYLVLQIDEHDSSVGYETRVEAAIRAFRNHYATNKHETRPRVDAAVLPKESTKLTKPEGKVFPKARTVLLPNWDPLVCSLLASALRSQGLDARTLEETPDVIRRAMSLNAGQCIPVSVIARETIDYIEKHQLDPKNTALWMIDALWPCNIPLYPYHIGEILARQALDEVYVYAGNITFLDLSPQATYAVFHAFLVGGLLRKLICRVRPYETEKGATDRAAAQAHGILCDALKRGLSCANALKRIAALFRAVPTAGQPRPKVAIFGDFYSRDNDVFNQDLNRSIEAAGGEVVVTPYIDYLKATCDAFFQRLLLERRFTAWATYRSIMATVAAVEKAFYIRAGFKTPSADSWHNPESVKTMEAFGLRPELAGECFDNTLKILRIIRQHPDVRLLVQANPAFCCPSIITEAMSAEIEKLTGVPVVTITYDGTGALKNDVIEPYLAFMTDRLDRAEAQIRDQTQIKAEL